MKHLSKHTYLQHIFHSPNSLAVIVLSLSLFGLVMVTSASIGENTKDSLYYLKLHGLYLLIGFFAAATTYVLGCTYLVKASKPLIFLCILALILVFVPSIGKTVNHSSRWLDFIYFTLQPSELAKLASILYIAGYIGRYGTQICDSFRIFARPIMVCSLLVVLIMLEPDLGGSLCLASIFIGMLFLAGARWKHLAAVICPAFILVVFIIYLEPYRLERITIFLDPWSKATESGYQLIRSLIAATRGGWFGDGLGSSIEKMSYLPEAHTDFIFSIIIEELGLLGAFSTITLFAMLIFRCIHIGKTALACGRVEVGYCAHGVGIWFAFQSMINIGMSLGLLPTKGITLPFLSAGGSSLIVCMAASGMLIRAETELRSMGDIDTGNPKKLRERQQTGHSFFMEGAP